MIDLTYMPATELAAKIKNGEVSAVEAVTAALDRIDVTTPSLNAVVQITPEAALDEARDADRRRAAGAEAGALDGIPMTVKDNLDVAGVISTGGTAGRRTFVPEHDATVVARAKAAGAIVLGKTNTPELTLAYETDNIVYGPTNNPYDTSRTTGGSSGGSAANLAVGGASFEIGSDTGGSLRVPSHYCGTAAIRPTSGRVPRAGHILPPYGALEALTTIGPMARTIADVELLLPVLAGSDWQDPAVADMPLLPSRDVDISTLRVAMYVDNRVIPASAETAAIVWDAARALEQAGATVEEAVPPGIEEGFGLFLSLLGADGGAAVGALLELYGTTEPSPFLIHLGELLADFSVPTPGDFDGVLLQWGLFKVSMLAFIANYDLVLTPVTPTPAVPHGATFNEDVLPGFSYTAVYNLTGWPAAVVRAGTSDDGLPVGVQIAATPWREDRALAAARVIERALGGFVPPEL
ncbi:MAG: amidase [Actinomycetota bacterium]|nr:amidase [Actinomycetota bacterium]